MCPSGAKLCIGLSTPSLMTPLGLIVDVREVGRSFGRISHANRLNDDTGPSRCASALIGMVVSVHEMKGFSWSANMSMATCSSANYKEHTVAFLPAASAAAGLHLAFKVTLTDRLTD